MERRARKLCPRCGQLERQLAEQAELLKVLRARVLQLEEKLAAAQKDSSTSSKPPSSDLVKPPPPEATGSPRSLGGQPGHAKHEREPFLVEQVTAFAEHALDACPCCGGELRPSGALSQVVQQVDVLPARLTVEQHTCPEYWCGQCQKAFQAPLPLHVEKGGLVGPHLTALIAYLKGVEPSEKREPISSVRTGPVDTSADGPLRPARTPNGLDARSFLRGGIPEIRAVA
jgi:transposase